MRPLVQTLRMYLKLLFLAEGEQQSGHQAPQTHPCVPVPTIVAIPRDPIRRELGL